MIKYVNHDIVFQEFPDEVTLAVNLSLCPNGCIGCHSVFLQADVGEELTAERLFSLVDDYYDEITCVGLMGGDNDFSEVQKLMAALKSRYGNKIFRGWYSGKPSLPKGMDTRLFDYVKIGPYKSDCGPLKSKTTNQRLYKVNHAEQTFEDITSRFWKN